MQSCIPPLPLSLPSVEIYKGNEFRGKYNLGWCKKPMETVRYKLPNKVIVFDLDETLGSFGDLYLMWTGVKHLHPDFNQFHKLMELYPEFLRYGILTILEFLYEKKATNECSQIFIYTNNRCSKEWVQQICKYFESQVHKTLPKGHLPKCLFNKLICAFKINNRLVEKSRTTHRKTYSDFMRCAMLPKDTQICFIDDYEHHDMKNSRVYYICPKPYYHTLTGSEIIQRFLDTKWFIKRKSPLLYSKDYWFNWFRSHGRHAGYESRKKNIQQDITISQKMLYHIKDFLMYGNPPFYRSRKPVVSKRMSAGRGFRQTKRKRDKEKPKVNAKSNTKVNAKAPDAPKPSRRSRRTPKSIEKLR